MDGTLKSITDFSLELRYDDLPPIAIHECKRRVVDTLACALGGFDARPSRIARAIDVVSATRISGLPPRK